MDDLFTRAGGDIIPPALDLFRFQYANNPLYREYTDALGVNPHGVTRLEDIPFLPIPFFKTRAVRTTDFVPEAVFASSGTTGVVTSRHEIKELGLYTDSFTTCCKTWNDRDRRPC